MDHTGSRSEKLRRAQLRVISPGLEFVDMPQHLHKVVEGVFKEIEDRTFRPLLAAPDMAQADLISQHSFDVFVDLWPAVLGALTPWLQEQPDRMSTMATFARDEWSSHEAHRLGDAVCTWFSAAQLARTILANAVLLNPSLIRAIDEQAVIHHCVLADFALLFGTFLVHEPEIKPLPELSLSMAKLAHDAATRAYSLATAYRFADQDQLVG
jgi:hypothetical protein